MALAALSGAASTVLGIALVLGALGFHSVPEGYVGVYWRGGALLPALSAPGHHLKIPVLDTVALVQTTVQTDKVTNIPCGTSGGTVIHFDRIEVVNQLHQDAVYATIKNYTVDYDKTWIYDKIHHEVNQFCSKSTLQEVYITKFAELDEALRDALQRDIDVWAPGIQIIAIRVTKPSIPDAIKRNYEQVESEMTKLRVAEQTQKLVEKEAETERKRALIQAEQQAQVDKVNLERALAQRKNEQEMAAIADAMYSAKAKAEADAELYRARAEADANKVRLTPELLQLESVRALTTNTKIFWGDKLPSLYADGASLLQPRDVNP